ncbi:MAG TPA: peptidase S14 [Allosphingosinicella sp.]|nr:peptidase S14 [Allosphingosinicella sp.]
MSRDDQPAPRAGQPSSWPKILDRPTLSVTGEIDSQATRDFLDALRKAEDGEGDVALELTTLGGDAEMARRIVLEIGLARKRTGKRFLFLGKTVVYSAGVTVMSAFPREDRWLTEDAVLLIHCRQLDKSIEISGPMRASLPELDAVRAQIENGLKLEERNFRRLIEGSDVGMTELCEKAVHNWYVDAEEALKRGLIAGIVS